MPRYKSIKKVLVIGSGPIIIGQAAEFDYAGTQACRELKKEGLEVVLINSNPATIMTDKNMADKIYIEPLTVETVKKIIEIERPDSILPNLGGQTGLNLAMELEEAGFLKEMNVKLLGTGVDGIRNAEDRQCFKDMMEAINEPCIASKVVHTVEDAVEFTKEIGLPVIIRPAYTLGGTGGGIAYTMEELEEIAGSGIRMSRVNEILVEKCITGWKEIEFEVMRDRKGNSITICSMENVDPVGVHTGDSIVVAPAQTLSNKEFSMLKSSALKIIEALKIEGGCNVQFALHPTSFEYAVIEVNPRVSRSSALASKATGYPIAKVASKIALGYTLDEIKNEVTGKTYACFEPTIDYVVVKVPKWPFKKFLTANRTLGTQMKATGEVMSIATNLEAGIMKAIRSLEENVEYLKLDKLTELEKSEVEERLRIVDNERIFVIAEAIRKEISVERISEITKIDKFFIGVIYKLIKMEKELELNQMNSKMLEKSKKLGFTDKVIAKISGKKEDEIRKMREKNNIFANFKVVDTCAAEFEAKTPYYYSSYDEGCEAKKSNKKKVVITSIEKNHKDKCVMLTKEDRKCIDKYVNDAYKDKLIKRRDNVFKIKRVLAMLVYLSRKCEKDDGTTQWIKKLNNVPNEITDLTLERLTGVSHKNMDACIALFERLGIVQSKIFCGGTKIKVLFPYHYGQVWIETADYNKAGTMIRDYFRLETNFREILPKIS